MASLSNLPRSEPRSTGGRRIAVVSAIILLLILAFYLRFERLVYHEIGAEGELNHLLAAAAPTLAETFERSLGFAHPPLPLLLLHLLLTAGRSLVNFRLLALVPGLCLIPLMFQMGRRATGTAGGVFLAGVAATGHASVQLSTEVRGYALFMSLWIAAFCFLLQWERTRAGGLLAWYFLFSALALLSHFTAAILIAATGIAWMANPLRAGERSALSWWLGHLLLALLLSILLYLNQFIGAAIPSTSEVDLSASLFRRFEYFFNPPFHRWAIVPVLFLCGLVSMFLRRKYRLLVFCLLGILFFFLSSFLSQMDAAGILRRSWYLFPVLALPSAFAVQDFWNLWSRLWLRMTRSREAANGAGRTLRPLYPMSALIPLAWLLLAPGDWRGQDDWRTVRARDVEAIVGYLEASLDERDIAFVAQWHNYHFVRYQQFVRREHSELFARVEQCSSSRETQALGPAERYTRFFKTSALNAAELYPLFLQCLEEREDELGRAGHGKVFFLTFGRRWTTRFAMLFDRSRTPRGAEARRGLECLLRTNTAALYQWKPFPRWGEAPSGDPRGAPRPCTLPPTHGPPSSPSSGAGALSFSDGPPV
jgi:hypothetical protein